MRNKRKALVAVLSVFALSSAGAALMTGCNATVGRIDAPTELEADLGTYVIPDYDVVDDNGMILAGYNVYLKSATDADGGELSINYGSVTVETAGIYKFVYSAGSKKVNDVTVSIDFADRTAPVINYDDRELPEFFIRGNSYKMPAYTLSGDYVREKCWSKVYYIDGNENETEVKIESGRFLVDKTDGSYAIRIHVEDAVGNANDYEYVRKVDGPETLVENRVLYFNEAFGERQVSCYDSAYKGEFVTDLPKVDGNAADPKEGGAYKVTFDGVTQTRYNEGCISMNVPAVINLYEYEYLEMWVYNDSEQDIVMGSMWWNDTKIEKGKWNKIVWSTREWGGRDGNKDATNTKFVDVTDISKMTIRFLFDYEQNVVPNGTFYLSSMNAIPKVAAKITEAECATQGGGVTFDQDKYFVNDTVNLSAKKVAGKVVDCYKVDGEVIAGSSFTVTSTAHTVEAVYTDDPLTLENMTWATPECGTLSGDSARYYKLGEGKNWVLKYDVYDIGASGWNYLAAYVGGTNQLLGFELVNDSGKFCGYGGSYKWGEGIALSADTVALIRGATAEKPLTVTYIREGNFVKTFIEYDGVSHFIATVDIVNTLGCTSGNSFGIGGRAEPTNATVHNIHVIESSAKTELVHATYGAKVVKGDDVTDFTNKDYRIGDTVILSAPKEKDGKLFLCFKVGNNNISGNSFVITQESVTVSAVYTDPCTITLGEGLSVDGKTGSITVASGTVIEVKYGGTAPAGKYFEGVFIGGNPYSGGSITVTADIEVTVKYEDRIANDNEKLNDISAAAEAGGIVYTNNSSYNPSGVEYVTDFGYNGADGTVDADNSLKVTLSGSEQGFSLDNGIQNLDIYSEIYFYAYTECNVRIDAGGWWCRDTVLVPGKWTKVSFGRDKQPQNVSQQSVWEHGIKQFIYSFTKQWEGTDIPAGTVVYVTAVYGVPYPDVSVTVDDNVKEYVSIAGACKQNQTITISSNGAPANKEFAYFTVNGVRIDGNTYKLGTESVVIGAAFTDICTLSLENGAATADGKNIVGKGAAVTLTHEEKTDKIFDYYLIDGEVQLHSDIFVTDADTHTIKAVYADSPSAITWANGGDAYSYEAVMGSAASQWKSFNYDGEVYGSSQYWAVSVNVKHTTEWNSFEFIQGTTQSLRIRFHQSNFFGVMVHDNNVESYPSGEFVPAYPTQNAGMAAKLVAGTTITCVRNGGTITLYADGIEFFTTRYAIDHTGDWFGVGFVPGDGATKPEMTDVKFITGKDKVEAYLQQLSESDLARKNASQLNNIAMATAKDSSVCEYVKTFPAGLTDERIEENGVMKVVAGSDDVGLVTKFAYNNMSAKYSEIYFYVYIESEQEEQLKRVAGGAYWETSDMVEKTNTWTKISLDADTIAKLADGASSDLSQFTFRIYSQTWNVDTLGEFTPITGKTIYVTSLYGVPKS